MSQTSHKSQTLSTASKPLFTRASFVSNTINNNDDNDFETCRKYTIGDNVSKTPPSLTSGKSLKTLSSDESLKPVMNNDSFEETCCSCKKLVIKPTLDKKLLKKKLKKQEERLRKEFAETFEKEIIYLKERFNFILQNEQARAACMLREAHRERKEKIVALQQQLECKNMAGLMYVMCAERTKCKVEKMQIIETYTRYINMLNDILVDGQNLILNLSRGYKTAARVDYEWQEKMKKIICEFQEFIGKFTGCPPDQNQYLIDLPKLLQIEASIEDDPDEDPIEEDLLQPVNPNDLDSNKEWWQLLDEDDRPFAVYGDMANFKPPQRREALKKVKAAKTAPRKWKEYVFHDMFLYSDCPNAERMKREYYDHIPGSGSPDSETSQRDKSKSIMSGSAAVPTVSTTTDNKMNCFKVGQRKVDNKSQNEGETKLAAVDETTEQYPNEKAFQSQRSNLDQETSLSGVIRKDLTDSLEVIPKHVPDNDHVINYERTCPVKACQRKHVDTLMSSLPRYMQASPYMTFAESFDQYETCSPEQLALLKERIYEKKKKEKQEQKEELTHDPLLEWKDSVQAIGVQTSDLSYLNLPPCTCRDPSPTPNSGPEAIYRLEDLIPLKQNLDQITKECLFDDRVEFQRFKVLGQESKDSLRAQTQLNEIRGNFTRERLKEIQKIFKQHPSLLDLFQANNRC